MSPSTPRPAAPQTPPPQDPPRAPAGNGRDARGRFTAGNKYGPGNPFARQTAQLRKVLLEVVNEEEMRQVAFSLLIQAKGGNLAAIKLLLQYVLGKPAEAVDPDRLEVDEWRLAQESKTDAVEMQQMLGQLPAQTANILVRHGWPAAAEANLQPFVEALDAMNAADAARAQAEQGAATAEANGDDGDGAHPEPPARRGGEGNGEADEAPAREGKTAKPQAAHARRAEANGGNGGRRAA
jgi:hypothetical protein